MLKQPKLLSSGKQSSKSDGISDDDYLSIKKTSGQIFLIEKVDRTLLAENKKALEVDRIMKMDIKYRPYEEEL